MKKSVIIVAGGTGKRMGADVPKQFLRVKNKTILHHTILAFLEYDSEIEIVVAIHADWKLYWENICEKDKVPMHKLVVGGEERFHSVQNALEVVTGDVIGVHDAVRPLVSKKVLRNLYSEAELKGNAIPVMPATNSLRKLHDAGSEAVVRAHYVEVQTPQCFDKKLIKKAYQQDFDSKFTDDASVVESLGEAIYLVSGNVENIKITTPLDLEIFKTVYKG